MNVLGIFMWLSGMLGIGEQVETIGSCTVLARNHMQCYFHVEARMSKREIIGVEVAGQQFGSTRYASVTCDCGHRFTINYWEMRDCGAKYASLLPKVGAQIECRVCRKRCTKTVQTDPDHEVIGRTFRAWNGLLYFCESWGDAGYYMRCTTAVNDLRCISERAIGRTFHEVRSTNG